MQASVADLQNWKVFAIEELSDPWHEGSVNPALHGSRWFGARFVVCEAHGKSLDGVLMLVQVV